MGHPIFWIRVLLGGAILFSFLGSLGVLVMKDSYQRLQYSPLVIDVGGTLLAIALWLETSELKARIKIILTLFVLWMSQAVITHAIARAARIRHCGYWELGKGDCKQDEQFEKVS